MLLFVIEVGLQQIDMLCKVQSILLPVTAGQLQVNSCEVLWLTCDTDSLLLHCTTQWLRCAPAEEQLLYATSMWHDATSVTCCSAVSH